MLPRDDQRPVFLERSGIDQAVDVLARHAVAQLPAPGDRVRPVLVQPEGVAVVVFAQVVADVIRVQSHHGGDGAAHDLGFLDEDDGIAFANHVARRHRDAAHDAAMRRGDHVLHLHRLDDGDLLALAHLVADGDVDGDDGALDRGGDPGRAVGAGRCPGLVLDVRRRLFRFHLGVMREQREGIATLDPSTGEPAIVRRGPRRLHEAAPLIRTVGDQRGDVLIDPAGVDVSGGEVGMREDVAEERDVGGDALQPELAERARGSPHRAREVRRHGR